MGGRFHQRRIQIGTGYTGEVGYELYVPSQSSGIVWAGLLEAGQSLGIKPCGLGSRDLLRLEVGYLLYGNDINEETTPVEAGAEWAVDFTKGEFRSEPDIPARSAMNSMYPPNRPASSGPDCWRPARAWGSSPAVWVPGISFAWRSATSFMAMTSMKRRRPWKPVQNGRSISPKANSDRNRIYRRGRL